MEFDSYKACLDQISEWLQNMDNIFYRSEQDRQESLNILNEYGDDEYISGLLDDYGRYFRGPGFYDDAWNEVLLDGEEPYIVHTGDYEFIIADNNED